VKPKRTTWFRWVTGLQRYRYTNLPGSATLTNPSRKINQTGELTCPPLLPRATGRQMATVLRWSAVVKRLLRARSDLLSDANHLPRTRCRKSPTSLFRDRPGRCYITDNTVGATVSYLP
jgi:hypothetical protein